MELVEELSIKDNLATINEQLSYAKDKEWAEAMLEAANTTGYSKALVTLSEVIGKQLEKERKEK